MHPLTHTIRENLQMAADPEYAPQMQAYMKSEMPYRGVKSAEQRQIYKAVFAEFPLKSFGEFSQVLTELWNAEYREERYAAITLALKYKKYQTMEALPIYRMMITTSAWWDLVDGVAADLIGVLLEKYPSEMKPEMERWILDEDQWIRRTAILSQLRFKGKTDKQMLFRFCESCLDEKSFWIRKAVGWALREYSKTDPDAVREFYQKNVERMSGVTRREVEKYI